LLGHIAWFFQPVENTDGTVDLYIIALAVDARFRRRGIGRLLFQQALGAAKLGGARSITLHVQTSNSDALDFYNKLGFEVISTLMGYYSSRIDPPDAHVLSLTL